MSNNALQESSFSDQFSAYTSRNTKIKYDIGIREVKAYRIGELFSAYRDILWDDGRHKYNVSSFIGEIDEILLGERFSAFDQNTLDSLIGTLRQRGNSNATINRKMAALSKLLRKAYKMGDIHSLPEFRRQKERAGRIRFLERDEEARLFAAIRSRSEDAYRLSVFLVDTGCRLGEALGLIWNDIQSHRVSFWITKSGRSRTIPLTERAREAVTFSTDGRRPKGPFAMLDQPHFRAIWNEASGPGRCRYPSRADVAWAPDPSDDDALRAPGDERPGRLRHRPRISSPGRCRRGGGDGLSRRSRGRCRRQAKGRLEGQDGFAEVKRSRACARRGFRADSRAA